jgi:Kdo2-lipid IVA lauroyltransferase/acyltransferase
VRFMPRKVELRIGDLIGFILRKIIRLRINIVRDNYKAAFPDASNEFFKKLEKDNYRHYGRLCMELMHLPFDAARFGMENVEVHGFDNFLEAIKKGKGVFILTSHVGYWEIMSVVAMLYKVPLNVITKYLRIKFLDNLWVKSRLKYGIKLIDENLTARLVIKAIKRGEAVGFVLDQFMGPPVGIKVNFFNRPAWTIASLAWFVEKTDAMVVPVVNYRRQDGKFDLIIKEAVPFKRFAMIEETISYNTQIYSNIIEQFIREKPEQWIWLHRRWKRVKEDD